MNLWLDICSDILTSLYIENLLKTKSFGGGEKSYGLPWHAWTSAWKMACLHTHRTCALSYEGTADILRAWEIFKSLSVWQDGTVDEGSEQISLTWGQCVRPNIQSNWCKHAFPIFSGWQRMAQSSDYSWERDVYWGRGRKRKNRQKARQRRKLHLKPSRRIHTRVHAATEHSLKKVHRWGISTWV